MHKIPISVLVIVHTRALDILLLERIHRPDYWQSVTGSLDRIDEPLDAAAVREVREETGIDVRAGQLCRWPVVNTFEIYRHWRHRFSPGTTHNEEHVYSVMLDAPVTVRISQQEHVRHAWRPWRVALEQCFSWTNRDAIRLLADTCVLP